MRHKQKHQEAAADPPSLRTAATPEHLMPPAQPPGAVMLMQSPQSSLYDFSQTSYIRTGSHSASNTLRGQQDDPSQSQSIPLTASTTAQLDQTFTRPALETMAASSGTTLNELDCSWQADQAATDAAYLTNTTQANENFAAWLFDSPGSQPQSFDMSHLPFFDFGIDYSPNDLWSFDPSVTDEPLPGPRVHSESSQSYTDASYAQQTHPGHTRIGESRRADIVSTIGSYWRKKKPPSIEWPTARDSVLHHCGEHDWPNVTAEMLEGCIEAFWREISRQLPIIHQPTFSCDECELLLLLSIIALGAGQIVRSKHKGALSDYRAFADLIATNLRWDIFTNDDAQPPVQLWVAQGLLCLEFYEKLYTSRSLHERAHIHHASTLTLLRRGSPMVGSSDDESPPSGLPTRSTTPQLNDARHHDLHTAPLHRWWRCWIQNESMHRVVFTAFQMDALHAVLFGHESVLLPYEVRLPLPCDDTLWTASRPEEVRRLEQTFSMHGIRPINFLDGLKRCLHGQEVQSHQNARMILVAGLLSVGWHIDRKDKHLQFLETTPSVVEQQRWRTLLLKAYGYWRRSFEAALGGSRIDSKSDEVRADILVEPSMLYHMAYVTTHVDIIDAQVLAGSKRLLGRKVSAKDHTTVVRRMRAWSDNSSSRLAVQHAFKVLHMALVPTGFGLVDASALTHNLIDYASRADALIYRPWILYLAALTIWSYQHASSLRANVRLSEIVPEDIIGVQHTACQYISNCAAPESPDRIILLMSAQGCAALLQVLADDFATAESELLQEAAKRLRHCATLL